MQGATRLQSDIAITEQFQSTLPMQGATTFAVMERFTY